MKVQTMTGVTQILLQIEQGDPSAAGKLLPVVYDELHALAVTKLAGEKPGQTLQATALVHEAYVRLVDVEHSQRWQSRAHFFGAAAEAMRRILVDKARRKSRRKHGGDVRRIDIRLEDLPGGNQDRLLIALDQALERFEQQDETACQLVKLRYFAGLSQRDAAEALGLAPRTADRLWAYAKAWLLREVQAEGVDSS